MEKLADFLSQPVSRRLWFMSPQNWWVIAFVPGLHIAYLIGMAIRGQINALLHFLITFLVFYVSGAHSTAQLPLLLKLVFSVNLLVSASIYLLAREEPTIPRLFVPSTKSEILTVLVLAGIGFVIGFGL